MIRKLKYIDTDSHNRPVYEDESGRLWKDTSLESLKKKKIDFEVLCSSYNNAFDGEPDTPMRYMDKYKDGDVEIVLIS